MRYIFITIWLLVVITLVSVSFLFKDEKTAIVAQVEPERLSVSFHKPVRVTEIMVYPGQKVKKGDPLLRVDRPDLNLDLERSLNDLKASESELKGTLDTYRSSVQLLELETLQKSEEIKGKILRLRSELAISDELFRDLSELSEVETRNTADSLALIDLKLLDQSLESLQRFEVAEKGRLRNRYLQNKSVLEQKIELQKREIELLKQEESELLQIAPFDGTIGNVYVEKDEVVDAFNNIISLYENNPSVIKAFMNEQLSYSVVVGQSVAVESVNREYQVTGEIIEIGSRIVQYPQRLSSVTPMYGQEIFVSISPDNTFLNGERVRVLID